MDMNGIVPLNPKQKTRDGRSWKNVPDDVRCFVVAPKLAWV